MEEESEINEEVKMNFSEKRTLSAQEKLAQLREKMKMHPPKSVIGKKLAVLKLNRLSNMVEKKILRNNMINLSRQKGYNNYEVYNHSQQSLMNSIADLSNEMDGILRQIQRLDVLDPDSKNSVFAKKQAKIEKNMPKGYKPKEDEGQAVQMSEVKLQKQQLEARLREIERQIEEQNEALSKNDKLYEESSANISKELKEELAVIKPNIFKRIGKFFKDKKEKFNNWRQQRKEKAQTDLEAKVEGTEGASKREMMLHDLASEYTPEQQQQFAIETKQRLEEEKNKLAGKTLEDKTPEEPGN